MKDLVLISNIALHLDCSIVHYKLCDTTCTTVLKNKNATPLSLDN